MSEPDLMTTQEVADWLRITRFSVYRYLQQGMPHYCIGPKHRFKRAEVEAWMKAQAEAIADAPIKQHRAKAGG
jgi:excisionase family DNA binding protein